MNTQRHDTNTAHRNHRWPTTAVAGATATLTAVAALGGPRRRTRRTRPPGVRAPGATGSAAGPPLLPGAGDLERGPRRAAARVPA